MKRKSMTLMEIVISAGILTFFFLGAYQLFHFISRTAAYDSFIQQVTLNENLFIRMFMEVHNRASLPAKITFPRDSTQNFVMEEKRAYCCYLRVSEATPKRPGPLLDIYQCKTEKENYPAAFPTEKNETGGDTVLVHAY
ncbi:hypothetical protein ACFL35_11590 [Candidatus Riflebacteria bacterium]